MPMPKCSGLIYNIVKRLKVNRGPIFNTKFVLETGSRKSNDDGF